MCMAHCNCQQANAPLKHNRDKYRIVVSSVSRLFLTKVKSRGETEQHFMKNDIKNIHHEYLKL